MDLLHHLIRLSPERFVGASKGAGRLGLSAVAASLLAPKVPSPVAEAVAWRTCVVAEVVGSGLSKSSR